MACFAATGAPPFGTFLSEWLILMKTIDLHYYVNTGLLLISLTLSFIVVCMQVGRVLLGGPNPNFNYFRAFATSAMPALLIICSLYIGLASQPAGWGRW